ncbi:MAG: hypothetical protein IIC01_00245 [Planctomycetes bacterium]|nr:hypothetical protein [Planctomycetota bacterium]
MISTGKDRLIVSLVFAVSGILLPGGCSGPRGVWRERSANPADAPPPAGSASYRPADAPRRRLDLAAIEEFLERTNEYHFRNAPLAPLAPAEATPAAMPSVDPTPRARTASSSETIPAPPVLEQHDGALANAQMTLPNRSPERPPPTLPVLQSVSIVVPIAGEPNAHDHERSQTTNAPMDAAPSDQGPLIHQLLTRLQSQAETGADVEAEWRLRLVQLAAGRDNQAVQPSPDLSEGANGLLTALFKTVVALRDRLRNPMSTGTTALEAAEELRYKLAEHMDPVVSTIALCRRVVTFGVYDEMSPADFIAGRTIQTIVYCEIRNFQSQLQEGGLFETRLGTRLELLTTDGQSMWQYEEPDIVDLCRQRRMDFFIAQRVALPPTLPAGEYVLKVLVEDKLSGRAHEAVYPLTLSSAFSVAKGL